MNRRNFLKLLLALPFVGRLLGEGHEEEAYPSDFDEDSFFIVENECGDGFITMADLEALRDDPRIQRINPYNLPIIMHPHEFDRYKNSPGFTLLSPGRGVWRGMDIAEDSYMP